ncbi:amidohydrolase [Burkholderia sp. MSh2]|uniref:Amidohydrolase n=1 Tax=Burkholderia paludis TaxID=1506587 RepID=A0A6J5F8H8_9BURK|nr:MULTISPECIES: M20 aminoacylase family protein [Burkholderia]KEZ01596.1 amidohydrolase [Burkholderia sp. MSh2]CAB3774081.1 Hippurate hydrolase [Burkholderia paludis]VWC48101.1 amidohydrolase [Burkholderia paludis]
MPTPIDEFVPQGMRDIEHEMIALRRLIHSRPELSFEEFDTSRLVAECLTRWGYEVHEGIGGTGVVGMLRNGAGRTIGLRADMDALPIVEATGLPYASTNVGVMHACGHDGHTAMLLAAAQYLARNRGFAGTVCMIFQPAEESGGGALRMLEDGLLDRFPCDAIFAMHNMPGLPAGRFGFRSGAFMASADTVRIRIVGYGGHGAVPHKTIDPVVAAASLVMALQTVVARNVDPLATAIVTVGSIHAGSAPNIVPDTAAIELSVRALDPGIRDLLQARITALAHAHAEGYGARAEVDYARGYPVLVNHPEPTRLAESVARNWLDADGLVGDMNPITNSEDFAYVLERCPGCYLLIGNGEGKGGCMVHNPGYDFNDDILTIGASYWVRLVERFLG